MWWVALVLRMCKAVIGSALPVATISLRATCSAENAASIDLFKAAHLQALLQHREHHLMEKAGRKDPEQLQAGQL